MTSYEFEKAAKNATIKVVKEYGIDTTIQELQIVWFTHCLGFKKCMLYAPSMGSMYCEVTYNRDKDEMYVDLYDKKVNKKFTSDEFDFEAKEEIK
jgi:hypothetical protein